MTKFRKSIAIVYHSPFGHTQKVAEHIAIGAQKLNIEVLLINVTDVNWELLDQAESIVFGCPTYMGSLTSALKLFMEQSSKRWLART
ncbi:NAD(P)H dehydrogenase (quinone) [Acinetobacter sp. DSM 11652]|nr:NAD(P)H dehydrogenase (quinone) [Acinetobacter sp. DSM 11652]